MSHIHGIKVATQGGVSLDLKPQQTPSQRGAFDKPLPNCVSVTAAWNPKEHRSAVLLEPTAWPRTRNVQVTVALELSHLQGQLQEVQTPVYFLVRLQRLPYCFTLSLIRSGSIVCMSARPNGTMPWKRFQCKQYHKDCLAMQYKPPHISELPRLPSLFQIQNGVVSRKPKLAHVHRTNRSQPKLLYRAQFRI